jgi:hypothetical protein
LFCEHGNEPLAFRSEIEDVKGWGIVAPLLRHRAGDVSTFLSPIIEAGQEVALLRHRQAVSVDHGFVVTTSVVWPIGDSGRYYKSRSVDHGFVVTTSVVWPTGDSSRYYKSNL